MASWIVALLFATGLSTWVYTKLMRSTGNNTKSSLIATGTVFLLSFFVFWAIMNFVNGLTSSS